ncbi:Uncharacterised protein [Acinetobacter baumannii]|nr:Uncharacterised protein [Acinetobacter baumannii]
MAVVSESTFDVKELTVPKSRTAFDTTPVADVFTAQLVVTVALTVKVPVAVAAFAV